MQVVHLILFTVYNAVLSYQKQETSEHITIYTYFFLEKCPIIVDIYPASSHNVCAYNDR